MDLTIEIANELLQPHAYVLRVVDFVTTRLELTGVPELALVVEVANPDLPGTHLQMLRFPRHLIEPLAGQVSAHWEHMTASGDSS